LVLKAPVVDAEWGPGGVYYSQENARKKRGESFGEAHVRYARRELDEMEATGERMFECLQGERLINESCIGIY
jgi:repressor of nif and glnA expression